MEEAGTSGVLMMAPFCLASSEFNKERSQIPQSRFLRLRALHLVRIRAALDALYFLCF